MELEPASIQAGQPHSVSNVSENKEPFCRLIAHKVQAEKKALQDVISVFLHREQLTTLNSTHPFVPFTHFFLFILLLSSICQEV